MDYVLRTFSLTKKYKRQLAVDHVNMTISPGDIYGFVGENGSGKTTVIRLITGLITPAGGSFELFGIPNTQKEIHTARRKVGAVVESPSIYPNMSAYNNLKMQCMILGMEDESKIDDVLQDVGLFHLRNEKKKVGNFSLGMRQRLGIAMALIGDPEFLILDEPMNGLDPAGIVDLRELILKLNKEKNITFLISSHILTELSLVATKYGIISKGQMMKEITAEELHHELSKSTHILSPDGEALFSLITKEFPNIPCKPIEGGVLLTGEFPLNPLLSAILAENIELTAIETKEPTIEDYYLETVGGNKA